MREYFLIYETGNIPVWKSDENITRKENYRPITLMTMNIKILSRTAAKQFQHYTVRIMQHELSWAESQKIHNWFNSQISTVIHHINTRTKKIDDHLNSTGITFDHDPTYIPDLNKETLSKPQIEGSFFKPTKIST